MTMSEAIQKKVAERLRSGRYTTEEDVLLAGLAALEDQESYGNFEPGELAALVTDGRHSIAEQGTIPAQSVFDELRQRSADRRRKST